MYDGLSSMTLSHIFSQRFLTKVELKSRGLETSVGLVRGYE